MATGIPPSARRTRENALRLPGDLELTYEGKTPEEVVLRTSPASLAPLWPSADAVPAANRLYYGENLATLAALAGDPAIRGQVRLVYIDPPYATGSVFQSRNQRDAYDDLLVGAHYVEFLRQRLILLRELLADDGSIYVHLDKNMAFAVKLIMDEVFGPKNFRSWITRKKCNPKNYTSRTYGNVADFLLFYSKTDDYVWHRPVETWTDARAAKEYEYEDEQGRRYKKVPIHAPGVRHGATGTAWRGMMPPPGKHWQYTPDKLDELDARGDIYWSPNGNPRRKVYFEESAGVPVQDIWLEFRDAHNQNIKITGYATEKNPDLLRRIVTASSDPGDLVLDCFAGSGTTMAVASELDRQWIGIDNSAHAIATTMRRFASGLKPMGDFVTARLAPGSSVQQVLLFAEDTAIKDFTLLVQDTLVDQVPQEHSSDLVALADLIDAMETDPLPLAAQG